MVSDDNLSDPATPDFDTLADRIRDEAAQAARPGQMERLEAIADEVEALRRGAKTLGKTIESLSQVALDVTGMHNSVDEDGDGDWGAIWESVYDIGPKALREAADSLTHVDLPSPTRSEVAWWLRDRADRIAMQPAEVES